MLISVIAIAMSLYHMYVAASGPPEVYFFRGTHLLFTLTLVFLLYPSKPGGGPEQAASKRAGSRDDARETALDETMETPLGDERSRHPKSFSPAVSLCLPPAR